MAAFSEVAAVGGIADQRRTAAGSDGFATYFAAASGGALRLAVVILGDRDTAEDVTQDAFASLFSKWSTVRSPDAYLKRAVVNGCRDAIRRAEGRRRVWDRLRPQETHSTSDAPRTLDDALDRLSASQRIAVVLRSYYQLTDAEIAELTSWPLGTTKSHLRRGLANLRKELS